MIAKEKVIALLEEHLKDTRYYIVSVEITGVNEIDVQLDSDEPVIMGDIVEISRYLDTTLDHEKEDFQLTLGSAGLTSDFKILRQYTKNIGQQVEVLIRGGKKIKGTLLGSDDQGFDVEIIENVKKEGDKRKKAYATPLRFSYDEVKYTRRLL